MCVGVNMLLRNQVHTSPSWELAVAPGGPCPKKVNVGARRDRTKNTTGNAKDTRQQDVGGMSLECRRIVADMRNGDTRQEPKYDVEGKTARGGGRVGVRSTTARQTG